MIRVILLLCLSLNLRNDVCAQYINTWALDSTLTNGAKGLVDIGDDKLIAGYFFNNDLSSSLTYTLVNKELQVKWEKAYYTNIAEYKTGVAWEGNEIVLADSTASLVLGGAYQSDPISVLRNITINILTGEISSSKIIFFDSTGAFNPYKSIRLLSGGYLYYGARLRDPGPNLASYPYLVEVDSNFNLVRRKEILTYRNNAALGTMLQLADSTILLGATISPPTGIVNDTLWSSIVHLDKEWNIMDEHRYVDVQIFPYNPVKVHIQKKIDGYYITSASYRPYGPSSITNCIIVLGLDSALNEQWRYIYPDGHEKLINVFTATNGDLMVLRLTKDKLAQWARIVRMNAQGDIVWDRTIKDYRFYSGTDPNQDLYNGIEDENGDFTFIGLFKVGGKLAGESYAIMLTGDGCYIGPCDVNEIVIDYQTSVLEIGDKSTDFNIYPNPTTGIVNFSDELYDLNNKTKIVVLDIKGTQMYKTDLEPSKSIDLGFLLPGIYLVQIKNKDSFHIVKLIKK